MDKIHLQYVNDVHMKVCADPAIIMELAEEFTHYIPNHKYHPKVKARVWDGRMSLVNRLSGYCYVGLSRRIKKFCDSRGYQFTFDDELYYDNISRNELENHIKSLNIPEKFLSRDYQFESVLKCIKSKRRLLLSPTSSGKSMMIYLIASWYKKKTLIIVPTTGLVTQFEGDLRDYGFKGNIVTSIGGLDKSNNINADIVVTTWQSLNNGKTKMPRSWYDQFRVVFGDEAHGYKATCAIEILSNLLHCRYRFGTTGTLDDDQPLNNLTIEGLFGPIYKAISTSDMIDKGYASKLKIKCIILRHNNESIKDVKDLFAEIDADKSAKSKGSQKYAAEMDYLIRHEARNKFIKNLASSLKGNKLVFFKRIEHGEILKELLQESSNTFHIDGSVSPTKREQIRKQIEEEDNCILVASMNTTATGVSINRLKHMIASSPSKSKIKVLQAIGRMLRLHEEKSEDGATLYDIVDDMSSKSFDNYSLKHFRDRCKIYDSEKFEYTIYQVKL